MQLQTLFAIISLQTRMRDFHLSFLSAVYYFLLLTDAQHQLHQSSSNVYLVGRLHSSSFPQHTPVMPLHCQKERGQGCLK